MPDEIRKIRGFTMIELMIVVALIGILAAIAIPSYQRFSSRSRQTAAKTELATAFAAEKSFQSENGTYHACWPAMGFLPIGINMSDTSSSLASSKRYYGTTMNSNCNQPVASSILGLSAQPAFADPIIAYGAVDQFCPGAHYWDNLQDRWNELQVLNASICPAITSATYCIMTIGCPNKPLNGTLSTTDYDVWLINENRAFTNFRNGI